MRHLGDFVSGSTVDFKFNTVSQSFAPITLAGSPAVAVYKGNNTTETTTGVTLTVDFDGRTGLHNVRVVLTDPFYGKNENYDVVLTAGTVDGVSVAGRKLASFTIEKAGGVARVLRALPNATANNSGGLVSDVWFSGDVTQVSNTVVQFVVASLDPDDVYGRVVQISNGADGVVVRTAIGWDNSTKRLTFTPPIRSDFDAESVSILNRIATRYDANSYVQADVVRFGGTAGTFSAGRPEVNTTHWGGTAVGSANVRANLIQIDGQTASASGTVTFPAATLASTTNITAGTITNVTTVNGLSNNVITAASIDANAITDAKIASGALTASKFASGAFDAVWTVGTRTLTSFGSLVADVWNHTTRILTAGTNIVLAKGTGITGFNDLSAAQVKQQADDALTDVGLDYTVVGRIDQPVSSRLAAAAYTAPLDAAGTRAALGLATANLDTQLSTINNNVLAINAGSGSGAYVVTVTVTDGANPLQNATVRLTEGANSFVATSNASGVATFALDAATYTISITKVGYTFAPSTVVVTSAGNFNFSMSTNVVPPPASPSGCVVVAVTRTQELAIQTGVKVGFRYLSVPAASGTLLPRNPLIVTSDSAGNVSAELLRGATVKYWRGTEPARADSSNTFTVPNASSYTLPDLLGEDAT